MAVSTELRGKVRYGEKCDIVRHVYIHIYIYIYTGYIYIYIFIDNYIYTLDVIGIGWSGVWKT